MVYVPIIYMPSSHSDVAYNCTQLANGLYQCIPIEEPLNPILPIVFVVLIVVFMIFLSWIATRS